MEKIIAWGNQVLKKINTYLDKGEGDRVRIFRTIVLLLWINVLGIFILSRANVFHILNPFQFLFVQPVDLRPEITLFYPGSIEELHEKSGSSQKTRIVELHQKTEYNDDYKSPGREKRILDNARIILTQLTLPPDSIRGVRAINDPLIVKNVWYYNGGIIVHLDKARVSAMDEKIQKITLACIEKSLQANLGAFTEIKVMVQ